MIRQQQGAYHKRSLDARTVLKKTAVTKLILQRQLILIQSYKLICILISTANLRDGRRSGAQYRLQAVFKGSENLRNRLLQHLDCTRVRRTDCFWSRQQLKCLKINKMGLFYVRGSVACVLLMVALSTANGQLANNTS